MNKLFIRGLSSDTRKIKPGDLFVALKGAKQEGSAFIEEAIQRGAVAVLSENRISRAYSLPVIPYSNLKQSLGYIAARFFDEPSKKCSVIGITGTNGKTSCSHFIASLCSPQNFSTAVMGTLGVGFLDKLIPTGFTTPDAITTQETLNNLHQAGAKCVAMEVTSHALTQDRVNGVQFHTAIFTNLTRDHLDYHENEEAYFQAKKRLFDVFAPRYALINIDDPYGQRLMQSPLSPGTEKIAYGILPATKSNYPLHIRVQNQAFSKQGMSVTLDSPFGRGEMQVPLLGHFNLSNVLASVGAACLQGLSFEKTLESVRNLKPVSGRMNVLGGSENEPHVVIDYAHTPDALLQVLLALKPYCKGKLWCIFGCGGERDPGKRPLMASVAEQNSDRVIVTQDNPRSEDPEAIIEAILKGFQRKNAVHIEPNRAEAILLAITEAKGDDWIVIAGKGHETVQIQGTEHLPFRDDVCATQALARRKTCAP